MTYDPSVALEQKKRARGKKKKKKEKSHIRLSGRMEKSFTLSGAEDLHQI